MEEIAKYGTPTTKHLWLDEPNAAGWKTVLLEYAITNSTIQLYRGRTHQIQRWLLTPWTCYTLIMGFCIVSSDSDFTRLAIRLRESGMKVIGMGRKNTQFLCCLWSFYLYRSFGWCHSEKAKKTVKYYRHKKPAGKTVEKPVEKPVENH
jgi:hypothetical protein